MAKPIRKPNGVYTLLVQFQGVRRQLTLGRISKQNANYFSAKIERLIDFTKFGGAAMPAELISWIQSLSEVHKQQLGDIGLFEYYSGDIRVGELLRLFLADYELRNDVTPSTKQKTRSTIENRFKRIESFRLAELEPKKRSARINAEAVLSSESKKILTDFNGWQRNFLAVATWSRDNKLLRSIGRFAVERGYCDFNPFSSLPSESMVNAERNADISVSAVLDVMEACLAQDTRLVLALARFSGFRTPSEVRTLKWEHVDFDKGQLTILDSKKKTFRTMPLFDLARAELVRQNEHTGGKRFVAGEQLRNNSDSDNYNRIKAAVARAGFKKSWDRLRQNLRASFENDMLELFPERLVAAWVGHTVRVSRDHYQKQRDTTFTSAIEKARESGIEI